MEKTAFQKVYTRLEAVTKATVDVRATQVSNDELAMVGDRLAQVVKIKGERITLQVFSGTEGLPTNAEVVFLGKVPSLTNLSGKLHANLTSRATPEYPCASLL